MSRFTHSAVAILFAVVLAVMGWQAAEWSVSAAKNPVIVAGTSWNLVGKSSGNLKGIGKFKENGTSGEIHFGPLEELAENMFVFVTQTSEGTPIGISGTYDQNPKGKLIVNANSGDVEILVATVVVDAGAANGLNIVVDDVAVTKTKQKAKAKEKKGVPEIKVQFQTKSIVVGAAEGETGTTSAKFSFKGVGGQIGGGAGGDDGGDDGDGDEFFPPQTYSDDFDSGKAGTRWGCDFGGCSWEVVSAGPLAPSTESAGNSNFVFQSPDPMALDPNRFFTCERFSAKFEQEGTFAFNYFVKTAGPVGFQDANELEVIIWSNTVEFVPEIGEEIPVASEQFDVLTWSGSVSGRSYTILPPGYYDFQFCYNRNRTFEIGPDFVQIDDVETCVGTSCIGELPTVERCQADQGAILVPDTNAIPRHIFTVNKVQGTADRYYVIIDTLFLEFVVGALDAGGPAYFSLRDQIDGVRTVVLVDGKTCDIDERKSILIEMSQAEIIDFVIDAGVIDAALDLLEDFASSQFYQAASEFIAGEIIGPIFENITEALIKSAIK